MSTTTEPKVGEWWWVVLPDEKLKRAPVVAQYQAGDVWRVANPAEVYVTWRATPIARIPDPPAPEPTEAERVDAMLEAALARLFPHASQGHCREAGAEIRKSIENAGYVLVPTSGEGFEAMVDDLMDGILKDCGGRVWDMTAADLMAPLRAALERCKGQNP